MEIVSVSTEQSIIPALVGEKENRVARVRIETTGSAGPIVVEELRVHLRGTTSLGDIESVEIPQGPREHLDQLLGAERMTRDRIRGIRREADHRSLVALVGAGQPRRALAHHAVNNVQFNVEFRISPAGQAQRTSQNRLGFGEFASGKFGPLTGGYRDLSPTGLLAGYATLQLHELTGPCRRKLLPAQAHKIMPLTKLPI